MKKQSIKVSKETSRILLQNQPILSNIEKALQLEPQSLKFVQKQFICYEPDPKKLKDVIPLLKIELNKYIGFTAKFQLEGETTVQSLLSHLLSLRFRFPSTCDLRFVLLSENKRQCEFYIYGTKPNSIEKIKHMIGKESPIIFEEYQRFHLIPSLVHKNYYQLFNLVDQLNLTTIPQDFEEGVIPTVYGTRGYMKEFKKQVDKIEVAMVEIIKIKTKTTIGMIEKNYFDDKFDEMVSKTMKTPPGYWCIFTQSGKTMHCELHVEKQFAQHIFISLTGFFDGIKKLKVKSNLNGDDVLIYNKYFTTFPAPMNCYFEKVKTPKTNSYDIFAIITINKDINPTVTDDWEKKINEYVEHIKFKTDDEQPPKPLNSEKSKVRKSFILVQPPVLQDKTPIKTTGLKEESQVCTEQKSYNKQPLTQSQPSVIQPTATPKPKEETQQDKKEEHFEISTMETPKVNSDSKILATLCEQGNTNQFIPRRPAMANSNRKPPSRNLLEKHKKMRIETNAKDEKSSTSNKLSSNEKKETKTIPKMPVGGGAVPVVSLADLQKKTLKTNKGVSPKSKVNSPKQETELEKVLKAHQHK
ncbi:hypothetical protein EHI8A_078950 [Entamoeba histolytica HM-1:IMSS-B]|uniref:Uncharacterized protein n=6 Tax=Entamoeba histolytica TaxID=5759 RepID=C4LT76_ENTH1|nr:hypothetical protein EHI_044540 [Entamoeba histolytica HM-1:IMSS]EMD46334.1 caldesmon, putative [Entamoeba histolytica KU27]EMH76331.1 hypothetical protein EHI8A_078950 [Entamoeba histolytica HM-1:IMSS-B]EMS13805.1 caldesmon, putative [Entamoeba histolytica HM-3:IMSS]ENY61674.1 caldesmon, putative [Entamoeba histolytica HM-1:IMSS-A]GAT91751.1 hypothetical protein CL6EHI_044540 [Entamoeba histolytica]|eukprot:XP_657242.2 hypothetical protein EHI_044540 [Entamoeba histolytica HM-1:IMSS]